jgi:hypothetical protein
MIIRPIRQSNLKHIGQSPQHYLDRVKTPSDSPSLRRGRAIHSYLLGEESRVVLCPMPRNEKHEKYQAFKAAHPDSELLSNEEFRDVGAMRRALVAHPEALALLRGGDREQTLKWEWAGQQWEGTPDVLCRLGLRELKSCESSHPDRFKWHALRYGYFAQLAAYRIAARELGIPCGDEHKIVAVENKRPYVITIFDVASEDLDRGERQLRLWTEKLLVCEKTGVWPGYCSGSVRLEYPTADESAVDFEDDGGDDD